MTSSPSPELVGGPAAAVRPRTRGVTRRRACGGTALVLAGALLLAPLAAPATAAGSSCPSAGGVVVPEASVDGAPDVVVAGHGWGHGMGMSQYGARGAALLGCSSTQILTTYYPGLSPARRTAEPTVMVDMLSRGGSASRAELTAEGGPVRWSAGSREVVQASGTTWTVRRGASGLQVLAGTGSSAAPVPALASGTGAEVLAHHAGTAVRLSTWTTSSAAPLVRRSDGDVARLVVRSTGLEVREVMVDDARGTATAKYLKGLAEMPVSWPSAAQEAQVVAARTFLMGKRVAAEGAYVVRPTTADQVWAGLDRQREDVRYGGGLARAVAATSTPTGGTVMTTAGGALARDLLYASSFGGWSESNEFVWGSAPVAHLRQVDDSRWTAASGDPNASWAVGLSWPQVARAFALTTATGLDVAPRGSSARTAVVVTGTRDGHAVQLRVTGQAARDALASVAPGVRSSGFVVRRPVPAATPVSLTCGRPVALDSDGDGLDEVGWFCDGTWTLRARDGSTRSFSYGRPGDLPVTGDWDGDGRDGVGVVRSAVWHLRERADAGAADRSFAYGRPGQTPVTGVWAPGRGVGVGVVVGGVWHLRDAVGPGGASRTWTFGPPTAQPVPGDWDGDGVDDPGAVDGARWTFGSSARRAPAPLDLGRTGMRAVAGAWDVSGRDLPGVGRAGVVYAAARIDDGRSAVPLQVLR